jgi:hypothetical protein
MAGVLGATSAGEGIAALVARIRGFLVFCS